MTLSRRGFIGGLTAALAAPAIVRAASLMPVKQMPAPLMRMTDAEIVEFLEGMSQQVVQTIIDGNPEFLATLHLAAPATRCRVPGGES